MIEPLRYNHEHHPTYEIARPVFCHACLCQKNSRMNPNIAVKFCAECPNSLGAEKEYGAYLCTACDDLNHKSSTMKSHVRQIIVVGPGVRKKLVVRGDGTSFPLPLDRVTIKLSSRIYQNGRRVHRVSAKEVSFISGMSGRCLHVQVLGARNLMVGDLHGSSDPFIVYSFCGKPLGTTRVRPRSTNPRWDNETFIVPMDENLPAPRDMPQSQKDVVRLEVYDHDWVTSNEFLGHVEITRSKLMKIALIAKEQPIRLPLTMKEYHGFVNLQFGHDDQYLHVKVVRAENVNMMNAVTLSNPYVKVYLGNTCLLGTTTTMSKTINPQWYSGNVFKIKLLQLLFAERYALSQIDAYNETQERLARMRGDTSRNFQSGSASQLMDEFSTLPTNLALFRVELYHDNRWRKHELLGKAHISVHKLRKMLPTLPAADIRNMQGFAEYAAATAKADQASAKLQAAQANNTKRGWLSCLDCFGKKRRRAPGSPSGRYAGAVGRAPEPTISGRGSPTGVSGSFDAGALPPVGLSNRRRVNVLGAASAGGGNLPGIALSIVDPIAIVDAPIQQPIQEAYSVASPSPIVISSPVPYPPSVRPAPPPMTVSGKSETSSFGVSAKSGTQSEGGFSAPPDFPSRSSSRRSRLPPPSAPPALAEGSSSQFELPEPSAPPEPTESISGHTGVAQSSPHAQNQETTPWGSFRHPGSGAHLNVDPEHGLSESVVSHLQSRSESRSQSLSQTRTPPPTGMEAGSLQSGHDMGGLAAGSILSVDSWEQRATAAGDIEQAQQQEDHVVYQPHTSSRPPPPALSPSADGSAAMHSGSVDNSVSVARAPFLQDKEAEFSSTALQSRKSRRNMLSMSFRAPPSEIVWSDSYPFPIMLDLGARRGVDAMGNPVSQGFIVLRLIPAIRGSVVLGLDEAVRQMTLGETSQVKCRFDYAYGAFSMGSHIPPRANVIFKVKLLELNGHGRHQVLYRMLVRFLRWFTRFLEVLMRWWAGEEPLPDNLPSRKYKRQASFSARLMHAIGLSSKAGTKGSDSESSEDSESEDEDDGDALLNGAGAEGTGFDFGSEDGSSIDSRDQNYRVKPDPRMRKHLNQSVHSGAQLMWNFKPPPKVKRVKTPQTKKAIPLYATKQLAAVDEQPEDADGEGDGDDDGAAGNGQGDEDFGGEHSGDEDGDHQPGQGRESGFGGRATRIGGVDFDDGVGLDGNDPGAGQLGSALEGDEDRHESDEED